ncbi:hypothetical protein ACEWY4_026597 [Coilia grayii]|uniref:Metalloendopeptidase n=1 Tax=Coilia grayii TaxID=363190 RepID=A0ABD1IQ03_9TELE
MDLRASISLLLLLLGLSQTVPLMEEDDDENDVLIDEPDDIDLTTQILDTNNGSNELLMEGDLVVPRTKNALACWNNACLWTKSSNGKVEVPYTVSSSFSPNDKRKIERAMVTFNRHTCIKFVPRSREGAYISIENRDGCFSSLGRTGGKQVLSLNRRGCVYHGIIQHELNHALGFYHEQTRSDRDQYATDGTSAQAFNGSSGWTIKVGARGLSCRVTKGQSPTALNAQPAKRHKPYLYLEFTLQSLGAGGHPL